jgi:hypothetical protein
LPAGVPFEIECNIIKPLTMDLINEIPRENGFYRSSVRQSRKVKALHDPISTAFLDAINEFSMRPNFKFTWFRYLPRNIHDSFLEPVENAIISKLSSLPILCSANGTYRAPHKFIIPALFSDADGEPLIPEAYVPGKLYYLSHLYNLDTDGVTDIRSWNK